MSDNDMSDKDRSDKDRSDKEKSTGTPGGSGPFAHMSSPTDPNSPKPTYKTVRPKRRRKGELNDGQWAPGYGPKVNKKRE